MLFCASPEIEGYICLLLLQELLREHWKWGTPICLIGYWVNTAMFSVMQSYLSSCHLPSAILLCLIANTCVNWTDFWQYWHQKADISVAEYKLVAVYIPLGHWMKKGRFFLLGGWFSLVSIIGLSYLSCCWLDDVNDIWLLKTCFDYPPNYVL